MNYRNILIALCLLGACFSCTAPNAKVTPSFDSKFNELAAQMTTDEVKKLLGPASLRELKDGIETWHYENIGEGSFPKYVQFKSGAVTGFGKEETSPSKSDQPSLPSNNREIGQSCKDDVECQSRNCHFNKCSGKDNCNVDLGKICATNHDCCSHFCDFNICRNPH